MPQMLKHDDCSGDAESLAAVTVSGDRERSQAMQYIKAAGATADDKLTIE
jgi:hypothetical protein